MGRFKIRVEGLISYYWLYYEYKTVNGVMLTRQENNSFSQWEVGTIPNGAIML